MVVSHARRRPARLFLLYAHSVGAWRSRGRTTIVSWILARPNKAQPFEREVREDSEIVADHRARLSAEATFSHRSRPGHGAPAIPRESFMVESAATPGIAHPNVDLR